MPDQYVENKRVYLPSTFFGALWVTSKHSGPFMMLVFLGGSLIGRIVYGNINIFDLFLPILSFFSLGFIEWSLHYYIWHENPLPIINKPLKTPLVRMHRLHHDFPDDLNTLFFGWKAVVVATLLVWFSVMIVFDDVGLALTLIFSFSLILFVHEYAHFVAHSNINPKALWLKEIINNHRLHHFKDETKWMGVSSTLPDKLFGTGD